MWTRDELLRALARPPSRLLEAASDLPGSVSGISIDSRSTGPGELFIALDPGNIDIRVSSSGRDGHDFLASAFNRGAAAALVHREDVLPGPVLRVRDTFHGLWALAGFAVKRCPGQRVALTGSSGKTTLRTFIETMARDQLRTHASPGSLNNHLGVPLSLARMPAETEVAIFEVGTNHPGEIAPLARLIAPRVAAVLNVAPAHLGNFSSPAALQREKLSIREGLDASGTLILPEGLWPGEFQGQLLRFGLSAKAEVRALNVEGQEGRKLTAEVLGKRLECEMPAAGEHLVQTSLAALSVAAVLGLDLEKAAASIRNAVIPLGRGNRVLLGGISLVDETYNANPLSTRIALETLGRAKAGRRLAIIGDMLELGDEAEAFHRQLAAACGNLDLVLTVGPLARALHLALPPAKRWQHLDSAEELSLAWLAEELRPGDELMIKGSNRIFWARRTVPQLLEKLAQSASGCATMDAGNGQQT